MNVKNMITASLVAFGLLAAQTASAQIQFFQNSNEAPAPIKGNVAMSFTIKADGSTQNVRITRTSGNTSIDRAAIAWMQQQTMRPVTMNGEVREFRIIKEIKFAEGPPLAHK